MKLKRSYVMLLAVALGSAACSTDQVAATTTPPANDQRPTEAPTANAPETTTTSTVIQNEAQTTTTAIEEDIAMASPFLLEPHDSNPVIERPSQDGGAMLPHVLAIDDQLHMWFTQSSDWTSIPTAIYHATSADGMDWTIDEAPALTADGNGFDAFSVGEGVVVADGEQWVMFYNAREIPGPGPGPAIGRATAPSPAGPWTADPDPILRVGEGAWDSGFVTPNAAISDDGSITIIYSGGTDYSGFEATSLGLAHAQNGVSFTKHDQPVMSGVDGWDGHYVWEAAVFPYDDGFGAFYTGDPKTLTGEAIGYAWSPDGYDWIRASNNPLLVPRQQAWANLDVVAGSVVEAPDGRMLLFYSGNLGAHPFLLDFSIGMAEIVPTD